MIHCKPILNTCFTDNLLHIHWMIYAEIAIITMWIHIYDPDINILAIEFFLGFSCDVVSSMVLK